MSAVVVMLESVAPMTCKKCHSMGSQNMVASDSNPFISVCANVLKYDSSNIEIQTDYTLHHDACSSLPHALARSLFCHLCRKFITDFHLR